MAVGFQASFSCLYVAALVLDQEIRRRPLLGLHSAGGNKESGLIMNRKKLLNVVACVALTAASVLTASSLAGCDEESAWPDLIVATDPGSQVAPDPGADAEVVHDPGLNGLVGSASGIFDEIGATPIHLPVRLV